MQYPIVIHKDPDSDYGVTVPDLPGCFSAGSTLDEAIALTREAILGHIEALIETDQLVPVPRPIEEHKNHPDYADADFWALVDVDLSNLPGKSKRINISVNERLLRVLDTFVEREGETRSGLIQHAVTEYIARRRDRVTPAA